MFLDIIMNIITCIRMLLLNSKLSMQYSNTVYDALLIIYRFQFIFFPFSHFLSSNYRKNKWLMCKATAIYVFLQYAYAIKCLICLILS